MPFHLERTKSGKYYVVDIYGRRYSKRPIPLSKAKKQIIAITLSLRRRGRI